MLGTAALGTHCPVVRSKEVTGVTVITANRGEARRARERPVGGRCGAGAAVARQAQGPGPGSVPMEVSIEG